MTAVAGRRVVLGVSGGIACYKACTIARRLTEDGAEVDVVMTRAATEFIRPLTFEALTGRPVITSLWDRGHALDHVKLGRDHDLVIVAPATAQLIARMAQGIADDFLTALLLARRCPVLLCPAMNDAMYANPATQANLDNLKKIPISILGPATGPLAHGEGEGPGRMIEPEEIVAWAQRMLRSAAPFQGKHVVVTAGPTREAFDPVRVVTNRSSGRMGYALAQAAWLRGAKVTLIAGPGSQAIPAGVTLVRVESTEEMKKAVGDALPTADCLIMAAAPADYAPARASQHKTKRDAGPVQITLEPTPDILSSTAYFRRGNAVMVGFALESDNMVASAQEKLVKKQLDLIVANDARDPKSGPESPSNKVTLVTSKSVDELPLLPKAEVAEAILDRVAKLMESRG